MPKTVSFSRCPERHLQDQRDQVGLGPVVLAERTVGAAATLKLQGREREFGVGGRRVLQNPLDAPFRPTVGADRLLGHRLDDRDALGLHGSHVELKTNRLTPAARIAFSKLTAPLVLLS